MHNITKSNIHNTKVSILEMYLDWVNNFMTLRGYAEYYRISEKRAQRIINVGKRLNGKEVCKKKVIKRLSELSNRELLEKLGIHVVGEPK